MKIIVYFIVSVCIFMSFQLVSIVMFFKNKSLDKQIEIINDVLLKSRNQVFAKQQTVFSTIEKIAENNFGTLLLIFSVNGNFHSELISDNALVGTPQNHILEIMSTPKQISIYRLV